MAGYRDGSSGAGSEETAKAGKTCTIDGCEAPHLAKGYCSKHYTRVRRTGTPRKPIHHTTLDSLIAKCDEDRFGCWVWGGAIDRKGYGSTSVRGVGVRVHKWVYEQMVDEVPDGLVLDHLCRNRACCNPYHLDPVTDLVNSQRGMSPSRLSHNSGWCVRGLHRFSEHGTLRPSGKWYCRACARDRYHERKNR